MQAEKTEIGASPEASFLPERVIAFMEGIDGTPCAPFFHFRVIPRGAGRSIPFLWCVARQAGTPVICSTTQPYSSASNQTLTGKGYDQG